MAILRDKPGEIVWIHAVQMNTQSGGITVQKTYSVRVWTDKKPYNLNVKAEQKDELLSVLSAIAPQATYGYSKALERQYKTDPGSLVRRRLSQEEVRLPPAIPVDIDDTTVAGGLFAAAEEWLREQGLEKMRGPASFTINDEIGLLIENFDDAPTLLTTWNPSYYQRLVESTGLAKAEDLVARGKPLAEIDPAYIDRLGRVASRNERVTVRQANFAKLDDEIDILVKVYAEAWSENWGAVPIGRAEFDKLVHELKPFLLPECTLIAEYDGEPVGVSVAIPDINVAVKACGGKLGPLGLIRFMLARRRIDLIRGVVGGVLKPFRNRGIEAALGYRTLKTVQQSRFKHIEFSWMLESNQRIHRVLDNLNIPVTKRWRVYERPL